MPPTLQIGGRAAALKTQTAGSEGTALCRSGPQINTAALLRSVTRARRSIAGATALRAAAVVEPGALTGVVIGAETESRLEGITANGSRGETEAI